VSVLVPGSHPAVFWVGDWFVSGGRRRGQWGHVPRVSILHGVFTSAGGRQPHHCAPFTSVPMASSLSCALYYVAGDQAMPLGSWLEAKGLLTWGPRTAIKIGARDSDDEDAMFSGLARQPAVKARKPPEHAHSLTETQHCFFHGCSPLLSIADVCNLCFSLPADDFSMDPCQDCCSSLLT
jgi:hypothetical protein